MMVLYDGQIIANSVIIGLPDDDTFGAYLKMIEGLKSSAKPQEDEGKEESNGDKPSEVVSKVVSSEKDPGVGNPEEGAALKVLVSMSDEPIPVKRKDPSGKVTRTQKAGAGAGKTSKPVTKPTKRIKPRSKSLTYSWGEVQNLMQIRLKKLSKPDQNGNESECDVTGDAKACKRKGKKETSKGQRVEHGEASPLLKPKKSSKLARANKEKVRVSHKPLTTVVVKIKVCSWNTHYEVKN